MPRRGSSLTLFGTAEATFNLSSDQSVRGYPLERVRATWFRLSCRWRNHCLVLLCDCCESLPRAQTGQARRKADLTWMIPAAGPDCKMLEKCWPAAPHALVTPSAPAPGGVQTNPAEISSAQPSTCVRSTVMKASSANAFPTSPQNATVSARPFCGNGSRKVTVVPSELSGNTVS
jgi:hypothetical protein